MSSEVTAIADNLERLIDEVFPDAVRTKDAADTGFGFSKGYKGLVFVVSRQPTYVNLGVAYGADLQDAFPILVGSGKVHRHVKIRSLEDLSNPQLRRLMKAALKEAKTRFRAGR